MKIIVKHLFDIHKTILDNFWLISINWGEQTILYDVEKNIGWIEYKSSYIIPISSVILII